MSRMSTTTRRDIENWIDDIDEDDPPDTSDPRTWSNFPCLKLEGEDDGIQESDS